MNWTHPFDRPTLGCHQSTSRRAFRWSNIRCFGCLMPRWKSRRAKKSQVTTKSATSCSCHLIASCRLLHHPVLMTQVVRSCCGPTRRPAWGALRVSSLDVLVAMANSSECAKHSGWDGLKLHLFCFTGTWTWLKFSPESCRVVWSADGPSFRNVVRCGPIHNSFAHENWKFRFHSSSTSGKPSMLLITGPIDWAF
jgi:hypothetical protein